MKYRILLLSVLAALNASLSAADHHGTPEDMKALEESTTRWYAAYNKHDAAELAKHYATDAEVVYSDGKRHSGRAQYQKAMEDYFKSNPKVKTSGKLTSRRFLSPTLVMDEGTWTDTGLNGPGPKTQSGTYLAILEKRDGNWITISERGYLGSQQQHPNETSTKEEFEEFCSLMVGRWVVEGKLIADWPGQKKGKGAEFTGQAIIKLISTGIRLKVERLLALTY